MDPLLAYSGNATLAALPSLALQYPFYHTEARSLLPGISDLHLSLASPVIVYWAFSIFFHLLDIFPGPLGARIRQAKIHDEGEAEGKNRVTMAEVIRAVFVQQALQTGLGLWWMGAEHAPLTAADHLRVIRWYAEVLVRGARTLGLERAVLEAGKGRAVGQAAQWCYWWAVPVAQFLLAAFILDTWQYVIHRLFHLNKFLYRHVHSVHHRLYVPYAFGALYNHPVEGFVLDSLGAVISEAGAFMSTRQALIFFTMSTLKTVQDHSGYSWRWNPIEMIFPNGNDFHDLHHQVAGLKYNFSQPYFIHFDTLFGTRLTRAEFDRRKSERRSKGAKAALESEVNGPNELAEVPTSERKGKAVKED